MAGAVAQLHIIEVLGSSGAHVDRPVEFGRHQCPHDGQAQTRTGVEVKARSDTATVVDDADVELGADSG